MSSILTEIVSLLGSGITEFATNLGTGIQSLVSELFLTSPASGDPTLSVFGGLVVIFAGIALTVNISVRIFTWLSSMGN